MFLRPSRAALLAALLVAWPAPTTTLLAQPAPAPLAGGPMMGPAQAPLPRKLPPERLAAMLQRGGYVVLMRHTSSPNQRPEPGNAAPGNATLERQLDAKGHADALAFGAALKRLGLRFASVRVSPTFRARQVAADAGLPVTDTPAFLDVPPQTAADQSAAALSAVLRQPTPPRANVLLITHFPNVAAVLGPEGRGLGEGDAAVIRPGRTRFRLVGAIAISDWQALGR
jgi:phosphohistidine phosphatase SixA